MAVLPYDRERLFDTPYIVTGNPSYNRNQITYECNKCDWKGDLKEMKVVYFNSSREDWSRLAGSAGS